MFSGQLLLATSLSARPELLYTLFSSSFFRPQDGFRSLGSAQSYDILLLTWVLGIVKDKPQLTCLVRGKLLRKTKIELRSLQLYHWTMAASAASGDHMVT